MKEKQEFTFLPVKSKNMNKIQQIAFLILPLCFLCLNTTLLAQNPPELADKVSILKLDQELPSRGRLGGVTVDRLGFIYVSNFRDAVWKISPKGKVTLLTDGLYGASGNTIDAKGNLYQANFFSHSIVKIDRFGNISPFIEKGLNSPVGMVFDKKDNLYVCNFSENNILKISPDKQISVFAEGETFNGPNGITIDSQGNLYVVNFNNNQVVKITPEGNPSTFANIPGVDGNAHLVYYNNNFYLTKIKSNQLFQINISGEVKLIGGTKQYAITEGDALQASFAAPNGIGVDPLIGVLYVNNVNGQWGSRKASTIEISKIELLTISQILSHYLDQNDIEGAKKAFWNYHKDPFHAKENLAPAVAGLGWQYMVKRNVTAALALFNLNSEAYPNNWRSYYNLAEVYKIIGQIPQAKEYYEKVLKQQPDNKLVLGKLRAIDK